jgi:transcription elongation factor Elf1
MKCNECKIGDITIDKLDNGYSVHCSNCSNEFNIPAPYKVGSLLVHNYELNRDDQVASSFSRKKETQETTELQEKYDKMRKYIEMLSETRFFFPSSYKNELKSWLERNPL